MQAAALLFLLGQVAYSFVLPIRRTAVVNQTEQAEVLTLSEYVWTTTVIIGTPGKSFTVAIDTTTSMLVVPDISSQKNNSFDASQSSTYLQTPYAFSQIYDLGLFYGTIGNDTVILGESFSSNTARTSITVPFATFGQASGVSGHLPPGVDGLLGLAFPALAPSGSTPVFQTAINQNDVAKGTFVIWLEDHWESSDNGTAGVIYYGNIDNLHCKSDQRKMYPLSSATTFQFTTPTVTTGNYTYTKRTQTFVDSLSSYIKVPSMIMANIFKQLNIVEQSPPVLVPCDTKIDLAFNFASGTEHVTELNLVLKLEDGTCVLAVQDAPFEKSGEQLFSLGVPFLRGRCTYFDVANQQIGFCQPLTHGGHNSL